MTQIAEKPNLATKIWFDTEFIEDGKTIDLLSIGLVREDGATYYAEPAEADRSRADAWVSEYVLPHLTGPIKPRAVIAAEIVEFAGPNPEFWAYYADYDWVALCQLYGRMIDLPDGWPAFCRDLQQIRAAVGASLPPQKSVEHHALADALWTKEAWEFLCRSSDALVTSQAAEIERLREPVTASDVRELVERLEKVAGRVRINNGSFSDIAHEAATALTDLEAENARLKAEVERLEKADETRAQDISRLTIERDAAHDRLAEALKALDEIAAEWL